MSTTKVRLSDGQDIPIALPAKRVVTRLAEASAEGSLLRFPATNGIPVWINPQYVAAVWQMPEPVGAEPDEVDGAEIDAAPAVNGAAHPEPVAG